MSLLNLTTPYEVKRIIKYHSNGIKAIYKNIEMQHIIGNLYKSKEEIVSWGYTECNLYCYYDNINIGIDMGYFSHLDSKIPEVLWNDCIKTKTDTSDRFIEMLDERVQNVQHIGNAQILLASHIKPENVKIYEQARLNYRQKLDEQDRKEKEEAQEKERQLKQEMQDEVDAKIEEAEKKILNNEQVINVSLILPTMTETSLVLTLMKKYNVDIPLKTQGWINKALYSLKFINDKYSYDYYTSSRNSTVFSDYLKVLVMEIKKAYNTQTEEEAKKEIELKKQIEEQKLLFDSIETINFKEDSSYFRTSCDLNMIKRNSDKYCFSDEEAEKLYYQLYKALKVNEKTIKNAVDNSIFFYKIHEEKRNKISATQGNTNISVEAYTTNGVTTLYYKKWFENKDTVHSAKKLKEAV